MATYAVASVSESLKANWRWEDRHIKIWMKGLRSVGFVTEASSRTATPAPGSPAPAGPQTPPLELQRNWAPARLRFEEYRTGSSAAARGYETFEEFRTGSLAVVAHDTMDDMMAWSWACARDTTLTPDGLEMPPEVPLHMDWEDKLAVAASVLYGTGF